MAKRNKAIRIFAMLVASGIIGIAAYFIVTKQFPTLFDRVFVSPEQMATLESASLTTQETESNDWPQWLGPTRDGRAPISPISPIRTNWAENPPQKVWSIPCGAGFSSFALVDDQLFTMDKKADKERVLCLNADTGVILWIHEYTVDYSGLDKTYTTGPRATPAVAQGYVVTLGTTGIVTCLKIAEQPTIAWTKNLATIYDVDTDKWGYACSPLIIGDTVIIQTANDKASIVAYDLHTGNERWSAGHDDGGYSSPIVMKIDGSTVIVAALGQSIVVIDPMTGAIQWQDDWETKFNVNAATPLPINDYVFYSSGYSKGCTLLHLKRDSDKVIGERVFFQPGRLMRNHHSNSVHRDGYLYGCDDQQFVCVNLRKAKAIEEWEARDSRNREFAKGCLILIDDKLLGLTQDGTLFLAESQPDEFMLLGEMPKVLQSSRCWTLPIFVDGRIYLRDENEIVCLDARVNQ